jgi:hypothetical protein
MRAILEIGLAFVDLVRAELEQSKRAVFNLGIALGLTFAAAVVLIGAIGLMLYAAKLALVSVFDPKWVLCGIGLGAFGCAGVLFWIASYKARHWP